MTKLDIFDTTTGTSSPQPSGFHHIRPCASSSIFLPSEWIDRRFRRIVRSSPPMKHSQHHLLVAIRLQHTGNEVTLAVSPEGVLSLLPLEGHWQSTASLMMSEEMAPHWNFDDVDGLPFFPTRHQPSQHRVQLRSEPAKDLLSFPTSSLELEHEMVTSGFCLRSGTCVLLKSHDNGSFVFEDYPCLIAKFD